MHSEKKAESHRQTDGGCLGFGFSCAGRFRRPPLGAQSRKTGMHTWSQPLLLGDSKEERRQEISLLRAERRQERVLMVTRDTANCFSSCRVPCS
jgi:hypothetical protein